MNASMFDTTLHYLKAMAHESRLRLLGILADGEWCVRELAELLDLSEPTISHHLSLLQSVGLVHMRPEGTSHFYQLNRATLQQLSRDLLRPDHLVQATQATGGIAWEQRVLNAFVDGDRLKSIPAQRKKRLVILQWLVNQFEVGQTYSEAEVNALLKRAYSDTATLRRELIATQHMQRKDGMYWRITTGDSAPTQP